MAHNPPHPDRFVENSPLYRAILAVGDRYGGLPLALADPVIRDVEAALRGGVPAIETLRAFEARPMSERLIGPRSRYPTTWDYGFDGR